MKAIIAAGGSGTRLRPLTFSSNKHLLPLANKPLLLYPIEAIAQTGITEVGIIVNETRAAIENLVGKGDRWGLKVSYINQEKPLGLAHVVLIAKDFIQGEPFVYHLGDNIFTAGIQKPFLKFQKNKPDALLTLVEHKENFRLGVPYYNSEGQLIKVVEKPDKPPNQFGIPGLYFFNHKVFEAFEGVDKIQPSPRGELEITELYNFLLSHQGKVETEEIEGRWMDPGKFVDMLDANAYLLGEFKQSQNEGAIEPETTQTGVVRIEEGARIVNSRLIGPVIIGKETLIQDSQIGPFVAINDHCKLEEVTIKNSIVMQDTTLLSIKTPIVDSLIGKNTEVWEEHQNTVSLFIGDHCRIRVT